jgi:hypothetical protein
LVASAAVLDITTLSSKRGHRVLKQLPSRGQLVAYYQPTSGRPAWLHSLILQTLPTLIHKTLLINKLFHVRSVGGCLISVTPAQLKETV